MIGIVVAAHGGLAEALIEAAMVVVQDTGNIVAVGVTDADDAASYERRLREATEKVNTGVGVLVLTDMFGGTPSNVGLSLHRSGEVEVLTGTNLPMLIKAIQVSTQNVDLSAASRQVRECGERAITVASEVLDGTPVADHREVTS
ncbi:MAG: hypothetical protein V3T05_06375 [Myxococcota bacterium]